MKKKIYSLLVLSVILIGTNTVAAQSLKSIMKTVTGSSVKVTGTWDYEGASVQFESNNLLKKAGGKLTSSVIEKNVNEQLGKVGFKAGITTFTFENDSTFTNTTNGKKLTGKYTYDTATKEITLKYLNHVALKATVEGTDSKMSLLFPANEFMSMITFIGNNSGIASVKGLTSILNSYDGMMIGLKLTKQ